MSPPFGLWSTVLGGFAIGQLIASAVFLNTSTLWFPPTFSDTSVSAWFWPIVRSCTTP